MHFPLTQWTLHAESLPDRLLDAPQAPAFSLPGADALSAFADLIGGDDAQEAAQADSGAPYALGGLFEEDLCGELSLTREVDFGGLSGDRALITFDHLVGSGEIYLGKVCIARFGSGQKNDPAYDMTGMPCDMAVDVSDALRLGRSETLRLRFDASRPAGVSGAAFLSVASRAYLSRVSIQPDAHRRTMTVRARISALQAGRYVLRMQAIPGEKGKTLSPARETDITLENGQSRGISLAIEVDAPVFEPGRPYAAPALKIELFAREQHEKGDGLLCDDALLMCGYAGAAPRAYVPLDGRKDMSDPKVICDKVASLGISAVSLPGPAPDALYRALTREGIAALGYVSEEIRPMFTRYPCLTLADAPASEEKRSLQASVWQMTGSVAFPRALDQTMTNEEMLQEASGRKLDADAQNVRDTLLWLRAVQIRMRAEAACQGRYQGALCSAQELEQADIQDALRTAFAPVHLSALPLSGAWWTGTRFSAALEAYYPEETAKEGAVEALAILEDEDGGELARFSQACRKSGYAGVIEAQLPDRPCVLTLRCALTHKGRTIEESVLPVYVGERGPLEAAF